MNVVQFDRSPLKAARALRHEVSIVMVRADDVLEGWNIAVNDTKRLERAADQLASGHWHGIAPFLDRVREAGHGASLFAKAAKIRASGQPLDLLWRGKLEGYQDEFHALWRELTIWIDDLEEGRPDTRSPRARAHFGRAYEFGDGA